MDASPQTPLALVPGISSRPYGRLEDGRSVEAWTLVGAGGMVVEVLTYGGAVRRLMVPDCAGETADVVLGFADFDQWRSSNSPYFGVIAGRIAGRVPGGKLRFNGEEFTLAQNDGSNHLHGGHIGLDKRLWIAEPLESHAGEVSLRLHYLSPDGEEGYPGEVALTATYTLTSANEFVFETEARAGRVTPVSLAQHSYFNLGGEGSGQVTDHEIQIFSGERMTTDESMTPLGRSEPVAGTAADFGHSRRLGEVLPQLWKQHGDLYRLRAGSDLKLAARVAHPANGLVLQVSTTHKFLQFYTGAYLDGTLVGKGGRSYGKHSGFCLECQGYPDPAVGAGDILVQPGQPQRHRTVYAFTVNQEQ